MTRSAIVFCFEVNGEFLPEIFLTQSNVFNTGHEFASTILTSSTVTAKAAGFNLLPPQAGQGLSDMYSAIFSRIQSELVSLYRLSKLVITPSNARVNLNSLPFVFLYTI